MASKCRKASYYDGLTGACEPCGLRCNNLQSRPRMCEDYICDKVPVSLLSTWTNETIRNSWIIIGLLPLLIVILFVFILVLRKLHQRKASTSFKSTEVPSDRNVVASSIKEDPLAEDVEKFLSVRNQQFEPPVACEGNCISRKNEITKLMIGAQRNCDCDTSLPLPATEEGATILVTTKTVELCGYQNILQSQY
ncbi:tumor necrosis factor receptor superfamily member 17-like isoform X2 [Scyliorhinus canicula]|uniref:tumor necrosis factor receptor superfamily member 17-like isoform X2 n=1 Tax=Scyliorhinus canicula TaxID=7830 RepID=UPI0018F35E75|nr:tumor necrosis factor receptor superfamily member 17-like isoform X2 [Scyliorhinus canicula]